MPKGKLVTEFTFDSAHYIKDYEGPCGRMHGHSYKVRVRLCIAMEKFWSLKRENVLLKAFGDYLN